MITIISPEKTMQMSKDRHEFNIACEYVANKILQIKTSISPPSAEDEIELDGLKQYADIAARKIGVANWMDNVMEKTISIQNRNDKLLLQQMPKTEFFGLLAGKSISIVGNGPVSDSNASTIIDNSDVVVRFNNFYNYSQPNVGTKVDIVFQTFTDNWKRKSAIEKNLAILREQRPLVCGVKNPERFDEYCLNLFSSIGVKTIYVPYVFFRHLEFTTGTVCLIGLDKYLKTAKSINIFGFEAKSWENYVETDAKQYKINANEEFAIQQECIRHLENLHVKPPLTE